MLNSDVIKGELKKKKKPGKIKTLILQKIHSFQLKKKKIIIINGKFQQLISDGGTGSKSSEQHPTQSQHHGAKANAAMCVVFQRRKNKKMT